MAPFCGLCCRLVRAFSFFGHSPEQLSWQVSYATSCLSWAHEVKAVAATAEPKMQYVGAKRLLRKPKTDQEDGASPKLDQGVLNVIAAGLMQK